MFSGGSYDGYEQETTNANFAAEVGKVLVVGGKAFVVGGRTFRNPSLWTASDMTTTGWWDGSDIATITISAGSLSDWLDKSGNSNDWVQEVGADQPTYEYGRDPYVDVDNSEYMATAASFSYSNFFMIGIYEVATTNDTDLLGSDGSSAGHASMGISSNKLSASYWGSGSSAKADGTTTIATNTKYIVATSYNTTDLPNALGVFVNGTLEGSVTNVAVSANTFPLEFGGTDGLDQAKTMREVIFVQDITTEDRKKIEGYLAWKWDKMADNTLLVDALPSDHPYKLKAPTQ